VPTDGQPEPRAGAAPSPPQGAWTPSEDLDDLDLAIVSELQIDGRRPYRAIARKLGVAEGTVRFRAKRLQQEGVLTVMGFANPYRLGYAVMASLLLKIDVSEHHRVIETLTAWPEVMYLSSCAGRADLYLQVVCRDHEDLYELLTERIPGVGGITDTETLLELRVHKAKYVYPGLAAEGAEADDEDGGADEE
jgi:Lrp/AsnC family transcriptional regulator for asnA, asnC and gidA